MLLDIKKMQSEAKNIQHTIQRSAMYSNNFEDALKHGERSFLHGLTIPLATFVGTQNGLDETFSIVANTNNDAGFDFYTKRDSVIHLNVLDENSIYLDSKSKDNVDISEVQNNLKNIQRIRIKAEEILEKIVGKNISDWNLNLGTISENAIDITSELLETTLEALNIILSALDRNEIMLAPVVDFEMFEDVIALNLIKIIKKGTDTINTQYIGQCLGLAIEAFISSDSINGGLGQELEILKKYRELSIGLDSLTVSPQCDNVGYGWNSLYTPLRHFNSDILHLDTGVALCSRLIGASYNGEPSLVNLEVARNEENRQVELCRKQLESESNNNVAGFRHPFKSLHGNVPKRAGIHTMGSISNIDTHKPRLCSMYPLIYTHRLRTLVLPKGKDFSNSFKAKYI